MLRYDCLEPGCGWIVSARSEQELVELVQVHMGETHNTFELEDVIIDAATSDHPGLGAQARPGIGNETEQGLK